jgi:SHS2 domain-containing protein
VSYRLRNHTADVAVEATGATLDDVFAAVADGLTEAHCEDVPKGVGERFDFGVAAESREALLFDYLDELIYQRDVREVLPADHEVRVEGNGEWRVDASARGVPLEAVDAREIKAVTYSEMALEETSDGWRAYVVFDV